MKEFELKYGCNPNQLPAKLYMKDGSDLPVTILNGRPGYINFLDASIAGSSSRSSRKLPVFRLQRPLSMSACRGCGGPAADGNAAQGLSS